MVKISPDQLPKENTAMTDSNVITLNKPEQNDPLQELLREGARKMLASAIEAEVATFIEHIVL